MTDHGPPKKQKTQTGFWTEEQRESGTQQADDLSLSMNIAILECEKPIRSLSPWILREPKRNISAPKFFKTNDLKQLTNVFGTG
jgi:hypothetical protein